MAFHVSNAYAMPLLGLIPDLIGDIALRAK